MNARGEVATRVRKLQGIATGLKVYNYLGTHPGAKGYQIAKALKMKVGTATAALARLERYGIVRSFLSKNPRRMRLWYPKEWYEVIDWDVALKMWERAQQ